MNIIVLLNMIMLALVTVLVALKTLDLINNIVLPIAAGICAASLGTAFIACLYAGTVGPTIRSVLAATIPIYENVFMRPALFALSTAQTAHSHRYALGVPGQG